MRRNSSSISAWLSVGSGAFRAALDPVVFPIFFPIDFTSLAYVSLLTVMLLTTNALLTSRRGHFAMESGYHADLWFDLTHLFDDPHRLQPFIAALANQLQPHRIDMVCGPLVGGARLAERVAAHLGIPPVVAERIEPPATTSASVGLFPIKYSVPAPSREAVRGKRVAIVDDAISAGSAVRGTFADLIACGAIPVALGTLFLFGHAVEPFATQHNPPLEALTRLEFNTWKPTECPLCAAHIPLERVSDAP
jgi:orotate phosphoribosyltransferase